MTYNYVSKSPLSIGETLNYVRDHRMHTAQTCIFQVLEIYIQQFGDSVPPAEHIRVSSADSSGQKIREKTYLSGAADVH
jgi:hypothetical protein